MQNIFSDHNRINLKSVIGNLQTLGNETVYF